jgi:hypothetical protein
MIEKQKLTSCGLMSPFSSASAIMLYPILYQMKELYINTKTFRSHVCSSVAELRDTKRVLRR